MKENKKSRSPSTSLRTNDNNTKSLKRYCIITFGCAQNIADSERMAANFEGRGYVKVDDWKEADTIVINTCVVRQQAEDRVYGLVRNIVLHFQNLEKGDSYGFRADNYGLQKNHIRINPLEIRKNRGENKEVKGELEERREYKGPKIIITGCLVGMAARDKTGKILARLRERMPEVDEFLPIEEVGFNLEPVRQNKEQGLVVISNGCNNFCTFCVVPFSRGREVSRPYEDIIKECKKLKKLGYKSILLLGQNVNSYGSDLVAGEKYLAQLARDVNKEAYFSEDSETVKQKTVASMTVKKNILEKKSAVLPNTVSQSYRFLSSEVKPVIVKHLGKYRIPTLFPPLLDAVAKLGFEKVDFMSSNPWDFSDELIDVIARNKNIARQIHLPVQSGSDDVLKRMNRWYTSKEYINLVEKLRKKVNRHPEGEKRLKDLPDQDKKILRYAQDDKNTLKITTDIIVGFCGETEAEFKQTVDLVKKIKFEKAYISIYSSRPMTGATIAFADDVPYKIKKERWEKLDKLINHKRKISNSKIKISKIPRSQKKV